MSDPASSKPEPAEPFSSARPAAAALLNKTNLLATQNAGQVLKLDGPKFGLGRHPDNQACIDDDGISRFHARISVEGEKYWVEDLGSSNGTYINGRRVTSCELNNGDTLNLGPRVSFRFSSATAHEERVARRQ